MLKKTVEGGFINPAYEKWNRIAGWIAVVFIAALFIFLVACLFIDPEGSSLLKWLN